MPLGVPTLNLGLPLKVIDNLDGTCSLFVITSATGGSGLIASVSNTNSIDLTVDLAGNLTADLNISASAAPSGYQLVTLSIQNDGLLGYFPVSAVSPSIYTVVGSSASPVLIDPTVGVPFSSTTQFTTIYVAGSGGAVNVSANPRIAPGSFVGQNLSLISTSNTNTVTIDTGNGIDSNGPFIGNASNTVGYFWDSQWIQFFKRQ